MKMIARILAVSCLGFLTVQLASAQVPSRPFLTGKWEGVMTLVGPQPDGSPTIAPPFEGGQFGFRLDIRQTNLVMYFQSGADWIAFGEGQDLRLNEQGRNSIVIAALPAGATGNLIETMMLNISRWDEETITVHMSRVTQADEASGQPASSVNSMGRFGRGDW